MDTIAVDGVHDHQALSDLLTHAREAMRVGQYGEVEQTCETIVEDHPEQPDAWFLLGVAALRNGKTDVAVPHLQRAVDMRRGYAPYRLALGQTLLRTGEPAAALHHFHDAQILSPLSHEAAFGQASAFQQLEQGNEAVAAQKHALTLLRRNLADRARKWTIEQFIRFSTLMKTVPGNRKRRELKIAMQLARRYELRGELSQAYQSYMRAHKCQPNAQSPLHALGRIAFESENYMLSFEHLEAACLLAPENNDVRRDLGRTLSRMARHDEALDLLEDCHNQMPDAVAPLLALGWARYRAGQSQRAISIFDTVLEQIPESVEAHYGRARALVDAGQSGEGKLWFRRTIMLDPEHAGALRELANLKDLTPADPAYVPLQKALKDEKVPAVRRSVLHMSAGAANNNCKSHIDGFEHYRRGNLLKDVVFDIQDYSTFVDSLTETFDTEHFVKTRSWGVSSDTPIFVLGMPRSGTSLVEQILASHSQVHGSGEREDMLQLADQLPEELNDARSYPFCMDSMTADAAAQIATVYLQKLSWANPKKSHIVDKMPGNFHHVGLIATLFPNARIIHCIRDPRDTCLSIYFGDFAGSHPYSYDLNNLGRYHHEYQRLMAHWHNVLPGRILDIRYEDMVEDHETLSRKMVDFSGLNWEPACLEFHKTQRNVRTRSNAQVRQPIYRSSLARWKPYEEQLQPLFDGLEGRPSA